MTRTVKVPGLSNREIERLCFDFTALHLPDHLVRPQKLPLLEFFESGRIQAITGFAEMIDTLPPGVLGETDFVQRTITLSENTFEALNREEGQARFTLSHEIGHTVMHTPYMTSMIHSKSSTPHTVLRRGDLPAYEDAEWQANRFASALLMPYKHVRAMIVQDCQFTDLMDVFGVSYTAASVRYEIVQKLMKP